MGYEENIKRSAGGSDRPPRSPFSASEKPGDEPKSITSARCTIMAYLDFLNDALVVISEEVFKDMPEEALACWLFQFMEDANTVHHALRKLGNHAIQANDAYKERLKKAVNNDLE